MQIAVLGCGSIGRRHIKNLKILGYRNLIAYDPSEEARQFVEKEYCITTTASIDKIWAKKPDVVLINAPPNLHVDLGLAAVKNGCHLFIEKPLAHTLDSVYEFCDEVKQSKLVNMVACNMRFHPGPIMIKKLLEEKTIGNVIAARLQFSSYLPRWRPWQDYRKSYTASSEWGGAILDCIHEIDLALWYLGPANVLASFYLPASSIGLETDGLAEIILKHKTGVLNNIHLNFIQRNYYRTCQIIGSTGTINWDFNSGKVIVFDSEGELATTYSAPDSWELNQMYIDELKHFLTSVEKGKKTMNEISSGISALEVALKARKIAYQHDGNTKNSHST